MHAAVEPVYSRGKYAARRTKDVNEQTRRLLELFDSCDAQDSSELEVNQIGKCLKRGYDLTVSEGDHHHHYNEKSLDNANKVPRPGFVAFDKDVKTNLPSLSGTSRAPTPSSSTTISRTGRSSRSTLVSST